MDENFRRLLFNEYVRILLDNNRNIVDMFNTIVTRCRNHEDLIYLILRNSLDEHVPLSNINIEEQINNEVNSNNDIYNTSHDDGIEDSRIELNFNNYTVEESNSEENSNDSEENVPINRSTIRRRLNRVNISPPLYTPSPILSPVSSIRTPLIRPITSSRRTTLSGSLPSTRLNPLATSNQAPERIHGVRNSNSLLYQLVNEVMLNYDNLENLDNLEPVLVRPTQEQINNATRVVRYGDVEDPQNHRCTISLMSFDEDTQVTMIISCGHMFNTAELNRWFELNTRCPLCRYDIRTHV